MTEIEIRDPDSSAGSPAQPEAASEGPYRNLLVPLVVVPALIVMVLVLVFVLFGALAGTEDSPRENLDRLLNGGVNERKQAAFNLVRQVLDHRRATDAGETPEWEIDASFLPELRAARHEVDELSSPRDVPIPLVLSSLLAQLGEAEGVAQLAELTRIADELDPAGEYRMYAAMTLGAIGPELAEPERELAARALIELLESPDAALVLVAIAGLQKLPSGETSAALRGMLASGVLERRGSAALSLATLGDPAGAGVLNEMLSLAPYDAERAEEPSRWPAPRVTESRLKALAALDALGLPPSEEELSRMAAEDPDPNVRRAAVALSAASPAR